MIKHQKFLIGSVLVGLAIILATVLSWNKPAEPNTPPPSNQTDNPPLGGDPTPPKEETKYVLLNVPFTSQAPTANWDDPRQQDGCEEASILMAWLWISGNFSMTPQQAEAEIIKMAQFQEANYGYTPDIDAQDTAQLMKDYFGHEKLTVTENISIEDIKNELRQGRIVIVPANGQKLGNPNFTGEGPYTHMLVIRGFDESKKEFITNDPGTRKGKLYRYDYGVLYNAMVNYPTGDHLDQAGRPKAMIAVEK